MKRATFTLVLAGVALATSMAWASDRPRVAVHRPSGRVAVSVASHPVGVQVVTRRPGVYYRHVPAPVYRHRAAPHYSRYYRSYYPPRGRVYYYGGYGPYRYRYEQYHRGPYAGGYFYYGGPRVGVGVGF